METLTMSDEQVIHLLKKNKIGTYTDAYNFLEDNNLLKNETAIKKYFHRIENGSIIF